MSDPNGSTHADLADDVKKLQGTWTYESFESEEMPAANERPTPKIREANLFVPASPCRDATTGR